MKRLPNLLFWLLLVAALASGWTDAQQPVAEPTEQRFTMTIDYGDGVQKRFTAIPWSPSMTVLDAMQWASRHPRGIEFKQRGRGQTALLTRIDDLTNAGGGGRNWIYRVNDQMGDRSFAIFAIDPGDRVLWRFEKYR